MGWVCAKAMHDGRLLDLPMSTPLCHTLLDRPLELGDMALVCPEVYKTLLKLMEMVRKKRAILKDAALSTDAKVHVVRKVHMHTHRTLPICAKALTLVYTPWACGGDVAARPPDRTIDLRSLIG